MSEQLDPLAGLSDSKSSAQAQRQARIFRASLAALNGRTPDEAKAWLTRNAQFADDEACRYSNYKSEDLKAKAGPYRKTAAEARSAANLCGVSLDRLRADLDEALNAKREFIKAAKIEKEKKAGFKDVDLRQQDIEWEAA